MRIYRDILKDNDVAIAKALLVITSILLESLLLATFAKAIPEGLFAGVLSVLVVSLVVGYVFSPKIQEDQSLISIGINVCSSIGVFYLIIDWLAGIVMVMGLSVVSALVGIFVGLYVGSMLRKPKQCPK